jgi:hypothetical protein
METYKLVDETRALKAHKQDIKSATKRYNFLCWEIRRKGKLDRGEHSYNL